MAASWLDWSRPLEVRPLANLSDAVRQPIGDLARDLPTVALANPMLQSRNSANKESGIDLAQRETAAPIAFVRMQMKAMLENVEIFAFRSKSE